MLRMANFIDGEFVAPLSGKYFPSYNPATGEAFAEVPDSGAEDIGRAVAAASRAFPVWKNWKAEDRAACLHRIADGIEARIKEFAEAETRDQGKTITQSLTAEMPRVIRNFRFFAASALQQTESAVAIDRDAQAYVVREPFGVVGLISPWNLPLYLLTWKIAPALAAGNCVVAKPSEMTSLTAHMLGQVLNEAGLPRGVCNIVLGKGATAGDALIRHQDVPMISFTGGTATGGTISSIAGPMFKRLALELGGKNPGIIFADADLDACIPSVVRSGFANQGEICLCNSRLFVEEKIFGQFVDRYVAAAKAWVVGDPSAKDTQMGPLVSAEHRAKVQSYIELAKSEGATIHCGGGQPRLGAPLSGGYFLEPTVITGVNIKSKVQQEEIFGPVVTITPFRNEAEAITLANDVRYGLAATIWTENSKRAHRMARAVNAGTVWVNTWMLRDLRVPFGGMKSSGLGREGGDYSLDSYTETKTICMQIS